MPQPSRPPEFLSTDELAQLTGRTRKTIWSWCKQQLIRVDLPPSGCAIRIPYREAKRVFPSIEDHFVTAV